MTPFCELVGCRLPIQQAAMTRVGTPALAAAVSEAGGLGMLAVGRQPVSVIRGEVDDVLAVTSRPVGATFIVSFVQPATLEHVAERLPVLEMFWGWPEPSLVRNGVVTGWQVGSVDEAKAAVDSGCRCVVTQGVEAGGHVRGKLPLDELVPSVRAAVDVPVVAAGGIGAAADVHRALGLGADAVRVGTRFLAAAEADTHPAYVDALVAAGPDDTVLTQAFSVGWPDAPHRVLASAETAALADGPDPVGRMRLADGSQVALRRRGTTPPTTTTTGQIEAMALYAGRAVGAVTARTTAAAIVEELGAVSSERSASSV
jgi:NAD(P)H-dependent flavin oxidoreductase YrpB (nitropropane dioxygenase family)